MTEHGSGDRGHGDDQDARRAETDPDAVGPDEGAAASEWDLSAVQADDALLDALGGADPRVGDDLGDAELNALLLAWRRDVDSEAVPELVDTPEAVTTVATAARARRHGGRGRRRMLVPVAAAAAVLAIGFTGTALAARDAQPGDTLWGLSTVLYADHARSVQAAASVRTDLEEAHLAIAQQRYDDARTALGEAEVALNDVAAEDELARLRARHEELTARLSEPSAETPVPPVTSSPEGTSTTEEQDTTTSTEPPPSSSDDELPPELDETSSIPSTEPSPSTEPTPSTSTTEEDTTPDESSGESRYGTSSGRSGEAPSS
ncbi:anti-sigma-D factor RsdA [Saccharomonospora saliphila]|uniref:anti-sigma-D factor RsdA n=1 Tax=Saccharomonospora saliphila TaxID=369829 RepID=UPI00037B3F7A|nr:anti-sigma-D factor RsdA [Saccharomonospora saliphila]